MNTLLTILATTLFVLVPAVADAQSTADCVRTRGAGWSWDGTQCINVTGSAGGVPQTSNPPTFNPNTNRDGFVDDGSVNKFCEKGKCTYIPLEPLPCPPGANNCQTGTTDFPTLLSTFFRLILTFGSLFAVVMLTIAGIGYMFSETAVKIEAAKKRGKAALIGLVLLTSAWLILYTLNPNLLRFDIFRESLRLIAPSATSPTNRGNIEISTPGRASRDGLTTCRNGTLQYDPQGNLVCYPNI